MFYTNTHGLCIITLEAPIAEGRITEVASSVVTERYTAVLKY